MRVLIVPDKFKGTLPARAVAAAMARGWRKGRPADTVVRLPMSDGGDGFGELISAALDARPQRVRTVDAAHRPCTARWWWEGNSQRAILESATAIGLALLPPGRYHPFELDTFGLGKVFEAAAAKGAKRCLIGIGGSATNDAGFGLALALGWQFFDARGGLIRRWTDLARLRRIQPPERPLRFQELIVAVDVGNPLLGARGATRVYGPQKGIRPEDVARAESCLRRLARVFETQFGWSPAAEPGAGAAGGLGFGLRAFLGARLAPGFDLFAKQTGLERQLRRADLVITGEGAIDRSTLMGKAVGQVAARCEGLGIPCIALAGAVVVNRERVRPFTQVHALTDVTSLDQAKAQPAHWLERLAARVARDWNTCPGA
jgi:glycerate kinase